MYISTPRHRDVYNHLRFECDCQLKIGWWEGASGKLKKGKGVNDSCSVIVIFILIIYSTGTVKNLHETFSFMCEVTWCFAPATTTTLSWPALISLDSGSRDPVWTRSTPWKIRFQPGSEWFSRSFWATFSRRYQTWEQASWITPMPVNQHWRLDIPWNHQED